MYSLVFSWRRNDMAASSSLRSGAGSTFHVDGAATAKPHGPQWTDFVGGTMRLPRTAERRRRR